jgi:hypothetical protein
LYSLESKAIEELKASASLLKEFPSLPDQIFFIYKTSY